MIDILVIGLILVALMVWASTRIKRSAAQAFEAEVVEGEGFSIEKPEGFLHKVNSSENAFEAYSKEFGRGVAEDIRAATAIVTKNDDSVDKIADDERARFSGLESDEVFELNGSHCRVVSGEITREGHAFKVREKIIDSSGKTLMLRVEVLAEQFEDYVRRIDSMLSSFTAK